ncbi:pyridoxal phosphate-dependent aminotransferase [Marinimicrobium locisalis]|uniref:pyridoxal phosphate-dependent aminotransferase n=1 Tax=Marinimicrobium locisalis TaxID=546022 RepID=UPI0032220565
MATKFARRVEDLEASSIFRINSKAQKLKAEGRTIFRLDAGDPDFETPEPIRVAGRHAIDEGYSHYTATDGLPELKDAVIKKFEQDNHLRYKENEVMVTCGAKQALFNLCMSVLHPGDEVVIPQPYWGSYPAMAKISWATPVYVPTRMEDGFVPSPEALDEAITERTRLVILNSPNNPSGQVYGKEALEALGKVLEKYPDVFVATDDIYEHLRWTGGRYYNVVNACPSLKARTIVINGVSKAYAMTGWRVGFCGGPEDVIYQMNKLQGQSTAHTAAVSQKAAVAALTGDQTNVREMASAYEARHTLVQQGVESLRGVNYLASEGTFYCLPDFSAVIQRLDNVSDDQQLADWLLDNAGVAMIPGSAFGAPGHMRLSFAATEEDIEKAMQQLHSVLN